VTVLAWVSDQDRYPSTTGGPEGNELDLR